MIFWSTPKYSFRSEQTFLVFCGEPVVQVGREHNGACCVVVALLDWGAGGCRLLGPPLTKTVRIGGSDILFPNHI